MAKHIKKDQKQFSELLYKSVMMIKDKEQVTEKVLNLTLEIICLLTGEDCIIVKKRSEHVAQDVSPGVSEEFRRTQNHCIEPSPNPLTHSENNDQALHPPTVEVPVRCEDVAVYLSMEEWEYLEEHKKHYEDMIKEKHQRSRSGGCESLETEITKNESDSEPSGDHQDYQENSPHQDTSTDESSNSHMPESCHVPSDSPDCTEEDNGISQDNRVENDRLGNPAGNVSEISPVHVEPGGEIILQQCKKEEIPTEMNTDETSIKNRPEGYLNPPYSQDCTEEDNQIPPDYQIEPRVGILPQQCKEEEIPTEISTAPQFILNNVYYTQCDEGSNLVSDSSSSDILRNSVTVLDTDLNLHKEFNLTDSPTEHTRTQYPSAFIKKHTKTNILTFQECVSQKYKYSMYDRNVNNELYDVMSHQRTQNAEMKTPFKDQAYPTNYSLISTDQTDQRPVTHQKIHTGDKQKYCFQCGKFLAKTTNFALHQRIHTGEKPYKCTQCGKSFTRNANLTLHQRIHTGEKPFQCMLCGKFFTYISNLYKHQRLHR
ncbi:uncharacterized protein WCC33_019337 [Rhinophrynus dorsalis]